jgi:hypothetical protein
MFSGTFRRTFNARSIVLPALQLAPITFRGRSEPIELFCLPLEKRLDLSAALPQPATIAQEVLRPRGQVVRLGVPPPNSIRTARYRSWVEGSIRV